jgi:hypothetical protein
MRRLFIFLATATFLCAAARAQDDQPSLGDVARQSRTQKQQKDTQTGASKDTAQTQSGSQPKDTQAVSPKPAHVITEDELSNHVTAKATTGSSPDSKDAAKDSGKDAVDNSSKKSVSDLTPAEREDLAEQWKEQIQVQKESIAQLQRQIADVGGSIHYAGGNCVQNCEQWNQNQQRKQDQVESMKTELQAEQQHLEEMQDAARKQGFGSNVYDSEKN